MIEAISTDEIKLVTAMLENKYPAIYSDIWKFGLNSSLRISDLLSIQHNQIDLNKNSIHLTESKTAKSKEIRLNQVSTQIIEKRIEQYPQDIYLFQSHSNRTQSVCKPISRQAVSQVFKEVGQMLKLNINTHTMRKSRGKALYENGVSIEMISKVLNHSSPSVSLRYIGIEKEHVLKTYEDFVL